MAELVIGVRGGVAAKSRCAARLSGPARAALTGVMLEDMLIAAAGAARCDGVTIVTPDSELDAIARRYGARILRDGASGGLNAAFETAARILGDAAPYADLAFLPGDLPLLAPSDLDALLALAATHEVVLAPAVADGGTGALVLRGGTRGHFAFGPESFERHRSLYRAQGIEPAIVVARSLGFDVDRPEDLDEVARCAPASRTGQWLKSRVAP